MSSWVLTGTPGYASGASGTVTVPADATVLQIIAYSTAGGTCSIFNGQSIPIPANAPPVTLDFHHRLFAASGTGANAQIVFTGTAMYFVHWVRAGNL